MNTAPAFSHGPPPTQRSDRQLAIFRIVAARQAISNRLQGLYGNPDHHAEREQIEDALRALAVLEAEIRNW